MPGYYIYRTGIISPAKHYILMEGSLRVGKDTAVAKATHKVVLNKK
jgi:hypothetical protein